MVTAFVLINVDEGHAGGTARELLAHDGVTEVHIVAGEYDMIAVLRVADNETLSDLIIHHIANTPGVQRTKTLFALQSFADVDLEGIFGLA